MGHKLKHAVSASEIARWCDLRLIGADFLVDAVASFSERGDGILCFAKVKPDDVIHDRSVLIANDAASQISPSLLVAANPRLEFARAIEQIAINVGFERPTAVPIIHPSAQVSPMAFIAPGVEIGPRSIVMPFAFIGEGVTIGADCIIKSGAVIGQDGFGFERDENGIPVRFLHLGFVVIGNNVEVGSLTTICRGALSDTIIEDDVKVDDHVHIAHNCHVRRGAILTACVELSGSVDVGEFSWIGPNSSIVQKAVIGANAFVGIASNITKHVREGASVAGNPARILSSKSEV
jgi:UDP-3-O-[3-hydroxymyristoyl] glucosamine N-acyltransferase